MIAGPTIPVDMGIKLGDIVTKRELADGELSSRRIAFDSYNMLYQFISSIRTPEGHPLTNKDGVVISHLKGIFSRTANLISDGVKPVFIFDGKPHELKRGTLDLRKERKVKAQKEWEEALERGDMAAARTKAMQTSHLTDEMVENSMRLLELMGLPYMIAPSDGEAQASYLCSKGEVYGASSQDFDSLLFGCPLLIRNLGVSGRRKLPQRKAWVNVDTEVISLEDTLNSLQIDRKQLVDMAILMGTDFNEGVKGIGPKKALKLVREFGDIETITKEKRIPLVEFQQVRDIFLEPDVTDDFNIEFREPDNDGLISFLVDELDFSRGSVERTLGLLDRGDHAGNQSSLDSFF